MQMSSLIMCELCSLFFNDVHIYNYHFLTNHFPRQNGNVLDNLNLIHSNALTLSNNCKDAQIYQISPSFPPPTSSNFEGLPQTPETFYDQLNRNTLDDDNETLVDSDGETIHLDNSFPQLDGAIGTDFDISVDEENTDTRTANYTLNHTKQIRAIQEDSLIEDFTVTVNNFDENTIIKCSSGFYAQVAKPCFTSLGLHSVICCYHVAVTLYEITPM